jgi:hypothetical protein
MARDAEPYAVLDLPYGAARAQSVLAQVTHHKPTIGGYALRPADYLPDHMLPPFYDLNFYWPFFADDVVPFDLGGETAEVLRAFGIRYVLLHRDALHQSYRSWATMVLSKTTLGRPVYQDDQVEVYRVADRASRGPVVVMTRFFTPDGWPSRLEPPAVSPLGLKYREIRGGTAALGIWSSEDTRAEISLTGWTADGRPVMLRQEVNGSELQAVALAGEPRSFTTPTALRKGTNWLTLRGRAALSRVRAEALSNGGRPTSPPGS